MLKYTKSLVHRFIKSCIADPDRIKEYTWSLWARPNQLAPQVPWRQWLILAGRGFGKTRTGAEWVRGLAEQNLAGRIALVGPTARDVRDVMIEGESGLLSIAPPWDRPKWLPSLGQLKWDNGAIAYAFSADEPDRLRGYQHDAAWCDELCAWRYEEAWDMIMMGLRLGTDPKVVVTTTPKPIPLLKKIMALPHVHITRGSTFENASNLAEGFLSQIAQTYEGTRLGLQELHGEILEDVQGALWTEDMLKKAHWQQGNPVPPLVRVGVAIDPAMTTTDESDETGIIVAGVDAKGNGYVLEDASGKYSADVWVKIVHDLYKKYEADRIVVEVNQGGDLLEMILRAHESSLPITKVRASRGKVTRAEPVAALYERGRIFHVKSFPKLNVQLKTYVPGKTSGKSPDRLDALVWAFTYLLLKNQPSTVRVWNL